MGKFKQASKESLPLEGFTGEMSPRRSPEEILERLSGVHDRFEDDEEFERDEGEAVSLDLRSSARAGAPPREGGGLAEIIQTAPRTLPLGDGMALDTGRFSLLGHTGTVPAATLASIRATVLDTIIERLMEEKKLALANAALLPSAPVSPARSGERRAVRRAPRKQTAEQGEGAKIKDSSVRKMLRTRTARGNKVVRVVSSSDAG